MIIPEKIVNPIGIDREMQLVQTSLENKTPIQLVFGKVEKEYNNKEDEPTIYLQNKEYADILQNDTVKSHLVFYLHDETQSVNNGIYTDKVSIICFVDLQKTYNFKHRATEEIIFSVVDEIRNVNWTLEKIVRGATKSLADFNLKIENFEKLQPFFVFRLDYSVNYSVINNCF
jgi:hypothetical protein